MTLKEEKVWGKKMKTKHKHEWEKEVDVIKDINVVRTLTCKTCRKISLPNKQPTIKNGCFGKSQITRRMR